MEDFLGGVNKSVGLEEADGSRKTVNGRRDNCKYWKVLRITGIFKRISST